MSMALSKIAPRLRAVSLKVTVVLPISMVVTSRRDRGRCLETESQVQLCVICIQVELEAVATDDLTHRSRVQGEDQGPQNRALWHTILQLSILGGAAVDVDCLETTIQVRCEPRQCSCSPYSDHMLQTAQQDVMVDSVECR